MYVYYDSAFLNLTTQKHTHCLCGLGEAPVTQRVRVETNSSDLPEEKKNIMQVGHVEFIKDLESDVQVTYTIITFQNRHETNLQRNMELKQCLSS